MSGNIEGSQQINVDDVRKAHAILHRPGQQVEVRVLLKEGGAMTGRFDNEEKVLDWIKDADSPDEEVAWWSIQQLIPEAATNDLQRRKASGNDATAARRWIFIDVDPVREHDPASDEELAAAESKYKAVLLWLSEHGIEPGMTAMSGNVDAIACTGTLKEAKELLGLTTRAFERHRNSISLLKDRFIAGKSPRQ